MLTGSSSDRLVRSASESNTSVTEELVVSSVVDYMYLVCHRECPEPVNFNDMSISCDFYE